MIHGVNHQIVKGMEDTLGFHVIKILQDRHLELYSKHITVKKENIPDANGCFPLDSVLGG